MLKFELVKLWVIKTASLLLITGGAVFALTVERSNNPDLVSLKGIPYVVPLILFLLAVGTFVLGRTAFGRHIYAVGGNATTIKNTQLRSGDRLLFSTARIVLSSIRIVPPSPASKSKRP